MAEPVDAQVSKTCSPKECRFESDHPHHHYNVIGFVSHIPTFSVTVTARSQEIYENFPHARSVLHQMSLLPSRMTPANTTQP